MPKEINHRWLMLGLVTLTGVVFDWWTKTLAVSHLEPGLPFPVMGDVVQFVLVYNKAALFGLDPRHLLPGFPLNTVFSTFMSVAILGLIVYYKFLKKTEVLALIGLATVLPGALGNLVDRLFFPGRGVVDFVMVDLKFRPFNPWPVFNIADAYITIGVIILLISMVQEEVRRKKNTVPA